MPAAVNGLKKCPKCQTIKEILKFNKNRSRKDGLSCWCTDCNSISSKKAREINPNKHSLRYKKWRLDNLILIRRNKDKYNFNLTNEQSDIVEHYRIYGRCFCCGKTAKQAGVSMRGGQKKLCLDHDHTTGKVRGILCLSCNNFEGKLRTQEKNGKIQITGWWKEYLKNPPGIPRIIQNLSQNPQSHPREPLQ